MNYFLLSITNTCNKSCAYCVVKPWLNNPEYPDKATEEDFIAFLETQMQAGDVVELTGGEPTMFPGLIELLEWLKEHGAKVIMRTNGALLDEWRASYHNMVVVLARHDSDNSYMASRIRCLLPQDIVLAGIPEHVKQKQQDKPIFVNDATSPLKAHQFEKMFFITNDGKVRFMACCKEEMGTIWDYRPRKYHSCKECPFALGAWNLAARI